MESDNKPIIRLEELGKEFKTANGPVTALENINLEIRQGEIFGIIGLSGAGKSTLVRCMNFLEIPTSGSVYFENRDLSNLTESEIRKVRQSMGMIFQQFICSARQAYLKTFASQWRLRTGKRRTPKREPLS